MIRNNVRTGAAKSNPESQKKTLDRERTGAVAAESDNGKRRRLGSHVRDMLVVEKGRLIKKVG